MSVLVSSKNIFLSTAPSGGLSGGGIDDGLNSFRATLNNVPLQTQNGEYAKISLVDFTMYRNFYYVGGRNNKVFFRLVETDGTSHDSSFSLQGGDFSFTDLQANFADKFTAACNALTGVTNVTAELITTRLAPYANATGNRKLNIKFTFADNDIASLNLQCRNYDNGGVDEDPNETSDFFNDSYALLGARRTPISDTTFAQPSGFAVTLATVGGNSVVTVKSPFPMQSGTMPNVYLRCQEVVDNLESETFKLSGNGGNSSHIVGSTILGKIPVKPFGDITNDLIRYDGDNSSQYYIMSDNKNISELFFRLTDAHGRGLPQVSNDHTTLGNLFCELTINFSVYTKGVGLPINNNIENSNLRNAMIQQGTS